GPTDRPVGRGLVVSRPARPPGPCGDSPAPPGRGAAPRPGDHLVERPRAVGAAAGAGEASGPAGRPAVLPPPGRRGRARRRGATLLQRHPPPAAGRRGPRASLLAALPAAGPGTGGRVGGHREAVLVGRAAVAGARRHRLDGGGP